MRRYIIFILIGIFAFSANVHSQPVNVFSKSTTDKMVENRLLKAVEKYNEGEYESAKKILNIVLMDDDSNDAAWYYQSLIAIHDNDLDLAQESLKRAVELDPMNFWYRYRLSMIYAYTGSEEVAADMYEKMLTDFPKKSELYFEMVDLYVNLGDYEKALDTIYEIERVFGQTDSLTLMASMETTDGLCPATNNTYNIGKASYKWKDLYVALIWLCPFNKDGYKYESEGLSEVHSYKHTNWTANNGNMLTLGLTWSINYGKSFKKVHKSLSNGGYDDGMVK